MAHTYYYCDGNNKVGISFSGTTGGTTYYDQYTQGDGTVVTEAYKRMTFTAASAPPVPIKIYYTYQTGAVYDSSAPPSNWYLGNKYITFPAGQTTFIVDVPVTIEYCYGSGEVGSQETGW